MGYNFNFIPTSTRFDQNQFNNDISNFDRKLKLKAHFGSTQILETKPKVWIPPKVHHTIETFLELFQKQIDQNPSSTTPRNTYNLSVEERLKQRNDFIIIKADKGGAVTILNPEDYIVPSWVLFHNFPIVHQS